MRLEAGERFDPANKSIRSSDSVQPVPTQPSEGRSAGPIEIHSHAMPPTQGKPLTYPGSPWTSSGTKTRISRTNQSTLSLSSRPVGFEQASRVFDSDSDHLEIFDEAHSDNEDRFITVEPANGELLIVIYTEPDDEVVRIISARPATEQERAMYRSQMNRYQ